MGFIMCVYLIMKNIVPLLAAISVSTGCISYGICMAYTSSAVPSMLEANNSLTVPLGHHETSWMSSLLALGALFGSLSAVYLMDAIGRKASLLAFSVMSLFIGWTLLMASSQLWQLYAGRFLLGLGAGLEITISPVYIHEICRPVLRDICGSFPQVFIALGILLCYIMGRSLEWNWLALASCLFLCPFTFGLYFIPESPPWLVYNDEEDLAFKSMVLIRGEEYDATVEIRRIKEKLAKHRNDLHALLHETETSTQTAAATAAIAASMGGTASSSHMAAAPASNAAAAASSTTATDNQNTNNNSNNQTSNNKPPPTARAYHLKPPQSLADSKLLFQQQVRSNHHHHAPAPPAFRPREILHRSVLYPFAVILVLMFLLQFSGQGAITFYTALIFKEAHCSLGPNDCALIIGVTYFLSSLLGLVLKRHVGRRFLLLISELGMGLAQISLGIYFQLLKTKISKESSSSFSTTTTTTEKPFYNNFNITLSISENYNYSNSNLTSNPNLPPVEEPSLDLAYPIMYNLLWLPIPILVLYTISFNVGMGSLTWVVATEILPVRSKRWTHTISNVTSNLWWFVVTKTFRDIYAFAGPAVPFFIYGGVCLFGFLFIYVFLPETHGKTAEETANTFKGCESIFKRLSFKKKSNDRYNHNNSNVANNRTKLSTNQQRSPTNNFDGTLDEEPEIVDFIPDNHNNGEAIKMTKLNHNGQQEGGSEDAIEKDVNTVNAV